MIQTLKIPYIEKSAAYICDNDVSKTMVKTPGGFLKGEYTTTTTNIQTQVIR